MTRQEKLLRHVDKTELGVEIGPSIKPIAKKKEGYRVHVIDHCNREELIAKFKPLGVKTDEIEEVDFVWSGQPYAELTGGRNAYGWVVASHVIEHVPDLIGFLLECDSILKADGVISLAIPDKRYCFDRFRPISGLARVIDSHLQRRTINSPGAVAEFMANYATRNGQPVWDAASAGTFQLSNTLDAAGQALKQAMESSQYMDVHAWVFTPHSFRLLIHDLNSLGFIPLKELSFFPSVGCEFCVTLARQGKGPQLSRLEMLQETERELAECRIQAWRPGNILYRYARAVGKPILRFFGYAKALG